jgi:hypothetical protein
VPLPEVVALGGGSVPKLTFIASGAVTKGFPVILDNSGAEAGMVKNFVGANTAFDTDALEGGVVGIAENGAADGQPVVVALFTAASNFMRIATYSTAPTMAILGVAAATLYVLYNDAGIPKVSLGTTTKGIVRFVGFDPNTSDTFTTSARGLTPMQTGYAAGDTVLVSVPESIRHFK